MVSVYLETSIFGAYVDKRDYVASRYQRQKTREWWAQRRRFELFSSAAVLAELGRGAFRGQDEAIKLAKSLPLLPITEGVAGLAEIYRKHLIMPAGESADAVHLALACFHETDFLLTWNCRHLANANKVARITSMNLRLGLVTPAMVTPPMLTEEP